jgi:uncharacterized protein YihD (DUF1040 family)
MREAERIERISNLFQSIWHKSQDMRFGQLYQNLLHKYCVERGWQLSDNRLSTTMWMMMEDADFETFLVNFKGFN